MAFQREKHLVASMALCWVRGDDDCSDGCAVGEQVGCEDGIREGLAVG